MNKIFYCSTAMALCIALCSTAFAQAKQQTASPATNLPTIRWSSSPVSFPVAPEVAAHRQQFDLIVKAAQDLLKVGKYGPAEVTFNQALAMTLDNTGWDQQCWKGLAQAYTADGQTDKALAAYNTLYTPPDGSGINSSTDDVTLLEYAILLSQAGQTNKAMTVYNHAIQYRNYEDGEQNTPMLFPTFGTTDAQARYTPQLLQALAHASISTRKLYFDDAAAVSEAQQAAVLAPDNGIVQFYLGQCLSGVSRDASGTPLPAATLAQNRAAARAAFQKAAALGGGVIVAAIKQNRGAWALAPSAQTQANTQAAK